MEPTCVWQSEALLGEGPVWDTETRSVYWLDITGRKLFRYDDREGPACNVLDLKEQVGSVALRRDGGLVAAGQSGFAFLDPETGRWEPIGDPESHLAGNRFNDGKCDPSGRFLAGSMDMAETDRSGSVYRLDPDRSMERLFGGYAVCNGPAFSPTGDVLYFADSAGRTILAADYDLATGSVGPFRPFARLTEDQGYPDGLTVDAEGCLWNAHWDGGCVTRYRPDGTVDRVIAMPVPRPTSCAFGGEDMDTLFVTSARVRLSDEQLAAAPLSGALFALEPGVRGLPPHRFAG